MFMLTSQLNNMEGKFISLSLVISLLSMMMTMVMMMMMASTTTTM